MDKKKIGRSITGIFSVAILSSAVNLPLLGQEEQRQDKNSPPGFKTTEILDAPSAPADRVASRSVLSISDNTLSAGWSETPATAPHPLDRAIELANQSLKIIQTEVKDYTGTFVKREAINGVCCEPGYVQLKVRSPRENQNEKVPFSIYMKFLKPRQSAGRECIWVDGMNESKIVAHEARGLIGMRRFYLEPRGMLAMRESRYPIYEAGLENLLKKLVAKAERDRAVGQCEVAYRENGELMGRKCLVIEVCHHEMKEPYDFHKAQVFMDAETKMPIRYAAFNWPETPGAKPQLIEEYIYHNLKLNVGLTDTDFSADNPAYNYPRR